jgi:TonB family protein
MSSSALFSHAPAMQSVFHSLNIGTLATWLSVGGFGTVGVVVHQERGILPQSIEISEVLLADTDFSIGETMESMAGGDGQEGLVAETAPLIPENLAEQLPFPPELPAISGFSALPEIPALPAPTAKPVASSAPVASKPATRSGNVGRSAAAPSGSSIGSATGGSATTTGMSASSRLAAGRMPAPTYPAECRRKGQSGTVLVEFTVDSSGRVISAHAKSPSPWPMLNHEAVRTVRKWKFPPGDIMKLQRPIVFQLR